MSLSPRRGASSSAIPARRRVAMPRTHQRELGLLATVLATCAFTGVWIGRSSPSPIVLLPALAGTAVVAWLLVDGTKRLARVSPIEAAVIAAPILVLPALPAVETLRPGASLIRFGFGGLLLLCLAAGLLARTRGDQPLKWFVVAFAAYQLVPIIHASSLSYGAVRAATWTMFLPFVFVAFRAPALRAALVAVVSIAALLIGGLALQLAGIVGGTFGGLSLEGSSGSNVTRYTSFAGNPNDFALAMLAAATVMYIASLHPRTSRTQVWALRALAALALAGVVLGASRGALLALVFVAAFWSAAGYGRRLFGLAAAAAAAVTLLLVAVPQFNSSIARTFASLHTVASGTDESAAARLTNWRERLSQPPEPTLGAGYGGYAPGIVFDSPQTATRAETAAQLTVDNGWLKLWLEEGFVGLTLFASVVALAIARCIRRLREDSHDYVALAAGSLLVALGFRGLSADVFDISPWSFVLWLLIGVAAGLPVVARRSQHENDLPKLRG